MQEFRAIRTAARRFCLEQIPASVSEPVTYQGETLQLYQMASGVTRQDAIRDQYFQSLLDAIETMPVDAGWSLQQGKDAFIALATQTVVGDAGDRFAALVVAKARQRFATYIEALSPAELQQIIPLPYRLVQKELIFKDIRMRLYERWAIGGCWFINIYSGNVPGPVIMFVREQDVFKHFGEEGIQETLRSHGITQIWQVGLWNHDDNTVGDIAAIDFYSGYEHCWTAEPMDWLIYQSHEDYYAFAGAWLIEAILAAWPGWQEYRHERVE